MLAVQKLNPPNITYFYTIPQVDNIKFRWAKRNDACRTTCGSKKRQSTTIYQRFGRLAQLIILLASYSVLLTITVCVLTAFRSKVVVCLRLSDRQKVADAYCDKYVAASKPEIDGYNSACDEECSL